MSMANVAKALGLKGSSSYQRYEDPDLFKKPYLPLHMVRRLADVLSGKGSPPVSREEILMLAGIDDLSPTQMVSLDQHQIIWCIGEVAAGVWREAVEWPRSEWLPFLISFVDERHPGAQRYALRVAGDSMDEVYPDGSYVVIVKLADIGARPKPGDRVVVLRHRQGQTEATVKEYRRDAEKRVWLVPRSSNPAHDSILVDKSSDADTVEIMGLVVGSQRIE